MSSPLILLLLGQATNFVAVPNVQSIALNPLTIVPEATSSPRRDDYTYTPGIGGYKLHTRAAIWNEARITCEEEGGHLAIINSIAEANVITELFNNSEAITGSSHPDQAYIGIHALYSKGQFVTIDGQTLARAGFTQWASGQPSGKENCGSVFKSGGLNDIDCATKLGFMCELPITQGYILHISA